MIKLKKENWYGYKVMRYKLRKEFNKFNIIGKVF